MIGVRESFSFFSISFGGSGGASSLGRKVVLRRIDGNTVQPRIESGFATKLRQCPVRLDKGVLGHVLDLRGVPHEARDQADDLAMVLGDQQFERGLVAFLHALDQHLVNFFFAHLKNPLAHEVDAGAPL
ncbi:hypothetical protein PT2222_40108 [Paraburkholderia tropica]